MQQIELAPNVLARLMRAVRGQGGFQSLLRKLRNQLAGNVLTVSAIDLERMMRYSFAYGSGGFQERTGPAVAQLSLGF
jgi:hypothetical protein